MKELKMPHLETSEEYFDASVRYYNNAREKLKNVPIRNDRYQDIKPVQEACGTGYLAALLTLDGYLLKQGVSRRELPESTDGYWNLLKKYMVHNGKIIDAFATVYEDLHILGYYRGGAGVLMIKEGFENAKKIIKSLSNKKL